MIIFSYFFRNPLWLCTISSVDRPVTLFILIKFSRVTPIDAAADVIEVFLLNFCFLPYYRRNIHLILLAYIVSGKCQPVLIPKFTAIVLPFDSDLCRWLDYETATYYATWTSHWSSLSSHGIDYSVLYLRYTIDRFYESIMLLFMSILFILMKYLY